jgi:NAD(P)H-flavin reductase
MKQVIYTIAGNRDIAPGVWRMGLAGDTSAVTRPGQFINIKLDESLCNGVAFSNGDAIKPLPKSYYSLSDENRIIIPKGQYN